MEDKHFTLVFCFICGLVGVVVLLDAAVFFLPISSTGQKYADNNLPVLNTGAMLSGVYYLLGGNPNKKTDTAITGDKTVINNTPTNN